MYSNFSFPVIREGKKIMSVTFRVALHYVRRDNYHLFMSCEVVELGLFYGTSLTRDLWRFVEMVFLLRAYSFEIECALCSMRLCVFLPYSLQNSLTLL